MAEKVYTSTDQGEGRATEIRELSGYVLCECGCGGKTKLAKRTDSRAGHIKGEPIRFLCGHSGWVGPHAWERLLEGIELASNGCWLWTKFVKPDGYGMIKVNGKTMNAHRAAYLTFVGEIPESYHIDHLCRVRRCINPAHLEAVTCRENVLRGIGPAALHSQKTHCVNGHEFTTQNTILLSNGTSRACRACRDKYRQGLRERKRIARGAKKMLVPDQVREIRRLRADGISIKELAQRFDCSVWNIRLIVQRKSWTSVKDGQR